MIVVKVVVPERLNEKQKKLLHELGESLGLESLGKDNRNLFERFIDSVGNALGSVMDWIEISVTADGEAAEAVSELFNRLNSRPDGQGGAVTEVGGWDPVGEDHHPFVIVKTYLPGGRGLKRRRRSARSKRACGSWAASIRWASRRSGR